MKSSILLLTVLIAVIGSSGSQCPSQQHLTDQGTGGSRSIPPLVASVEVTSQNTAYVREEIFAFEYPLNTAFPIYAWCSDISGDHSPNVTIIMTQPVLLYGLRSGGYSATERVVVFSLEYSETAEGDVVPYQLQGDTVMFKAPDPTNTIPLVLLPRPIVATTLYFHILEYMAATRGACWTLTLLGCPVSEAIEEELPSVEAVCPSLSNTPSATPLATSSAETPSETPSTQSEEEGGGEGRRESDSQAVVIAVCTSLLTVLAVAAIVAVGVILCWRISTRNRVIKLEPAEEQRERVYTIRAVENELYTDPNTIDKPGEMYEELKSPSSSSQSQTQDTMDDVLYATPNTNTTANHLQVYEPVQPPASSGGDGSMVNNPQYLSTAVVDRADEAEGPLIQSDTGYEMMSPAAAGRGGKWREEYSHTYANTETVRAGEDDTPP